MALQICSLSVSRKAPVRPAPGFLRSLRSHSSLPTSSRPKNTQCHLIEFPESNPCLDLMEKGKAGVTPSLRYEDNAEGKKLSLLDTYLCTFIRSRSYLRIASSQWPLKHGSNPSIRLHSIRTFHLHPAAANHSPACYTADLPRLPISKIVTRFIVRSLSSPLLPGR